MTVTNEVPDSAIKLYGNNWVATVLVSDAPSPGGFFQVYCTTVGATQSDALAGAEYVLNAFAYGREAAIRVRPEANSDTDFDSKETRHRGIVRFSYALKSGDWHYPDPEIRIPSIGAA